MVYQESDGLSKTSPTTSPHEYPKKFFGCLNRPNETTAVCSCWDGILPMQHTRLTNGVQELGRLRRLETIKINGLPPPLK